MVRLKTGEAAVEKSMFQGEELAPATLGTGFQTQQILEKLAIWE